MHVVVAMVQHGRHERCALLPWSTLAAVGRLDDAGRNGGKRGIPRVSAVTFPGFWYKATAKRLHCSSGKISSVLNTYVPPSGAADVLKTLVILRGIVLPPRTCFSTMFIS